MTPDTAKLIIRSLYEQWAAALNTHNFQWLEENLANDFQFSARPYPELRLDKAAFIEADRKMQSAEIDFVEVRAELFGDIIISVAVADVMETFDDSFSKLLPHVENIEKLVGGNRLSYTSAWKQQDNQWKCFDHHMVGPVSQ